MNDVLKMLKEDMRKLSDRKSPEGQENRKMLGIENLNEKELMMYKLDFLAKYFSKPDFHIIEKRDYFLTVAKFCLDGDIEKYFDINSINCVEVDSSLQTFCLITDKATEKRVIYCIKEEGEISKVTQKFINQRLKCGMHPLSDKPEILQELKGRERLEEIDITEDKSYMRQENLSPTQTLGRNTIYKIYENINDIDMHYRKVIEDSEKYLQDKYKYME